MTWREIDIGAFAKTVAAPAQDSEHRSGHRLVGATREVAPDGGYRLTGGAALPHKAKDVDQWESEALADLAALEAATAAYAGPPDIHEGRALSPPQGIPERPRARVKPTTYEDHRHPGIVVGQISLDRNVR
ncbi:MAG: hypothetical protein RID91_13155 [Azospirillaceae bacterium]